MAASLRRLMSLRPVAVPLNRVLINLVKNSIQAIPDERKGSIELKLWHESNKAIIKQSSQIRSAFVHKDTEEFPIKCNLHPFLQTRGVIVDNPYYVVSDAEGHFEIGDIPPGTYDVMAWHPFIPILKGTVTVEAGKEARLDFTFDSRNVRRKLYQDDTEGYRFNTWYDSFEDFYGGPRVDDPVEVLQEFDNTKRYKGYLEPF